jgi:hypothetical protein
VSTVPVTVGRNGVIATFSGKVTGPAYANPTGGLITVRRRTNEVLPAELLAVTL